MTETQATSGTTGTSMDPVGREEDDVTSPVDRSAVGRASVPADGAPGTMDGATEDHGSADGLLRVAERDGTGTVPGIATGTGGGFGPPGGAHIPSRPPSSTGRAGTATGSPSTGRSQAAPRTTGTIDPATAAQTGAARVAEAVRSARTTVAAPAGRGPRRARLFVKRIDPWSVMKFSFAVSFVMFFVLVVATSVLYLALDQMNVFTSVNKALASLFPSGKDVKITAGVVIGGSGAIGLVLVVLFTALSTLGAFVYNVCADLVGGIEVTLSEKE
jgi:hypothetical protein